MVVNVLQQVFALKIIHDYVGGVVFLKISLYVYNALCTRKPSYTARLAQEAFLALFKRFGLGVGCGVNLVCLRVVSVGVSKRIIFLYRNAHLKLCVPARVGDAEAALANGITHYVVTVEHGSRRKVMHNPIGHILLVAVGTNSARVSLPHAVKAIH